MLLIFETAIVLLGASSFMQNIEGAMAQRFHARQDSSSAVSSAAAGSFPISPSASPSDSASAAASATKLSSEIGSITSATVLSGTHTLPASVTSGADTTAAPKITIFSEPSFTETRSSAWHAHGVNATVNSTWIYTGTQTASTATSLPAGAVITGGTGNRTIADIPEDFIACRINATIENQSPFCSPEHGQQLWVGHVYAVNWNSNLFSYNATNYIEIRNANKTPNELIYTTAEVPNVHGYINLEMIHNWLLPQAGNDTDSSANITFTLISTPSGGTENRTSGPTIHLTLDPNTLPRIRVPNPIPTRRGLEIGLPIGLVALVIIALSICCAIRKSKRNWREMGHYGKDYMRKRRKRSGKGKGDSGIELSDYDFDSSTARAERFEDEPTRGGNAFRDEIERQKEEDYRNRAQKITSF